MSPPVYQRGFGDDDLRKHGCVLASLAWVRGWAGNDRLSESRVDDYLRASGVSLKDFRRRGVMLGETAKAATLAYPGDRLPPVFRKIIGGKVETDLFPDILSGSVVLIWANYAVVQDDGYGVGSWRGGHAVVYAAIDGEWVVVADPLRRQLIRWPRATAIRTAERFGKKKRINALVVKPSLTHTQEIARYRGLMQKARGQRDTLKVEVAALRAREDGIALDALRNKVKDATGRLETIVDELDEAAA